MKLISCNGAKTPFCRIQHHVQCLMIDRADFAGRKVVQNGAPIMTKSGREWVVLQDLDIEDEDFARLGADYGAQPGC